MDYRVALITTIGSVIIAVVSGIFGLLALKKSSKSEKKTDNLVKVLDNTNTPVKDLLELVGKQQEELDKQSSRNEEIDRRHASEVAYFERQLTLVRKELALKDENLAAAYTEIDNLKKKLREHETRLNEGHIGEGR